MPADSSPDASSETQPQAAGLLRPLFHAWSTTRFAADDLSSYAERLMIEETRRGLIAMAAVFLILLAAFALVSARLELDRSYVYTSAALGALAIHVCFAARAIHEIRTLHVLGMTLLVISGSSFVLLAHRAGGFGAALFSAVVLLYMVVPMVPWGLREASIVTMLIYGLFSSSIWSVAERFDAQTAWALQVFMLTAGAVSLTLVARGANVRKADIRARFDLESAHRELERLSREDPLTGAWNRRFLESEFPALLERLRKAQHNGYFALLDLDHFKQLNDTCGHAHGDRVLQLVGQVFREHVAETGHLVRTGGDEFTLLTEGEDPEPTIAEAVEAVREAAGGGPGAPPFSISVGLVVLPPGATVSLERAYRRADQALYRAKARRDPQAGSSRVVRVGLSARSASLPAGETR